MGKMEWYRKRNKGKPTSVNSAVAVEISLPGGEILLALEL
jgi:hypothetical protein